MDPMFKQGRMRECGKIKLPGWDFDESPVTYRDPHHPVRGPGPADVFFTKHFRYAWQREFGLAGPQPRDGRTTPASATSTGTHARVRFLVMLGLPPLLRAEACSRS